MISPIWSAINLSEGRDLVALEHLAQNIQSTGVNLVDWSADPDHNRAVFSLVDNEANLKHALELMYSWALTHIDIRRHQGQHPRLGAVDVVPFVPVGSSSIDDAQKAAHSCAEHIALSFDVPIIFYRQSSPDPQEPRTLPSLRHGGLESLTQRLNLGELHIDLGPPHPHLTLGVSVFGARPPLVAFNCLLNTTDLNLGRRIASRVRSRGGGPPGLQALAFPLKHQEDRVQISMNLLLPEQTPPHLAFLQVSREAEREGVQVIASELVGLLPDSCVRAAFAYFLKLDGIEATRVIR